LLKEKSPLNIGGLFSFNNISNLRSIHTARIITPPALQSIEIACKAGVLPVKRFSQIIPEWCAETNVEEKYEKGSTSCTGAH
jgi:hypothetical protein